MGMRSWVEQYRPQYLREYIGQDKVRDQLQILSEAAKCGINAGPCCSYLDQVWENDQMAFVIANELGVNLKQTI